MPYVAPMPDPSLVTGPDWTTALGAIALGLTKGVGEGAELIQRDRAQRMAEQNAAKEQAFRDRQADLAEKHFNADEAYRGEQSRLAKVEREGEALAALYQGNLPDTVPMENSGLPGMPEIPLDQRYSPEVIAAARRHVPKIRETAVKLQNTKEQTAAMSAQRNAAVAASNELTEDRQHSRISAEMLNTGRRWVEQIPDEQTMMSFIQDQVSGGSLAPAEAATLKRAWYLAKDERTRLGIAHPTKGSKTSGTVDTLPEYGEESFDPRKVMVDSEGIIHSYTGRPIGRTTPQPPPSEAAAAYSGAQQPAGPKMSPSTVPQQDVRDLSVQLIRQVGMQGTPSPNFMDRVSRAVEGDDAALKMLPPQLAAVILDARRKYTPAPKLMR